MLDWEYTFDPSNRLSCTSFLVGASRTCREAVSITGGETLILADGQNNNNTRSLYLGGLAPDGKIN